MFVIVQVVGHAVNRGRAGRRRGRVVTRAAGAFWPFLCPQRHYSRGGYLGPPLIDMAFEPRARVQTYRSQHPITNIPARRIVEHVQISSNLPRYVFYNRGDQQLNDCHEAVLDSSIGKPAAGVPVQLQSLKSCEGTAAPFDVLADGLVNVPS